MTNKSSNNKIEKQLHEARQNLLDLTMRNRLLNFKTTNAKTIKVIDCVPADIYDILVLQEKKMEFSAVYKRKVPQSNAEVVIRQNNRFLQTSLELDDLKKYLFKINHEAQSVLEEQGYTVLYLALGFLEWTENINTESRLAPLILIPVELERTKIDMSFKVVWTGEDIFTNISLQAKLLEQNILLPEFEMPEIKSDIDTYFKLVDKAISKKTKWRVLPDIHLGFFSFMKFVMYKDLDSKSWPDGKSPVTHPLIKAIFNPSSTDQSISEFSENDVDEKLDARDLYHIMDADPSQIAVIEDVKAGINLVVEGPPGTGKSQTIANIIAELLAAEKTVLFVSEKMAALEVVKSRLDLVGIGDFCLELHSRKSNKKEVLEELRRTIERSPPKSISLDYKFDKLDSYKSELNDYAKALKEPLGEMGISPFKLFCIKEGALRHFEKVKKTMPQIKFSDADKFEKSEWSGAKSNLSDFAEILPSVKPIGKNPWNGCETTTVLPSIGHRLRPKFIPKSLSIDMRIKCLTLINIHYSLKSSLNSIVSEDKS